MAALSLLLAPAGGAQGTSAAEIADYAALPITGLSDGAGRFFVNDLTGPLYILDRGTKTATTYLEFNGRGTRPGRRA